MKVYKFIGDYKKLKELGYNRFNILSIKGINLWGRQKPNCTIVVSNYVSVKPVGLENEPAITIPSQIKAYITELIENNLVEVAEMG